ncbi:hypothetical protein QBC38DRAFT_491642 [Podospora fimiseda]|uniref:Secreted protein n=1 Tax=Podospora fimiseda TaxID=252190 RepID=A0AAN6YPP8_9PEZI|nr:hypothetical protein QBC38DRAFT_491642 [Podospora fimiseda]
MSFELQGVVIGLSWMIGGCLARISLEDGSYNFCHGNPLERESLSLWRILVWLGRHMLQTEALDMPRYKPRVLCVLAVERRSVSIVRIVKDLETRW